MSNLGAGRFAGLDLLRGVAALAVVALHVPHTAGGAPLVPRAYLAVDLFFALSGFVLAHRYGDSLARPGNVRAFLVERVTRLYPLYLIALGVGALIALNELALARTGPHGYEHWGLNLAANLYFLPTVADETRDNTALFPLLFPAWSLMWELIANLAYALIAPRLGKRLLAAILCLGLAGLGLAAWLHGDLNGGVEWPAAASGGARVLWAFFAGVALERFYRARGNFPALPGWLLAALLLAAFLPAAAIPGGWAYDVAAAAILMPALVLLGAAARADTRAAYWLGYLSYGAYLFQAPVLLTLDKLSTRLFQLRLSEAPPALTIPLALSATAGIALIVTRRFDAPMRAGLRRLFAPAPPDNVRKDQAPATTMPRAAR